MAISIALSLIVPPVLAQPVNDVSVCNAALAKDIATESHSQEQDLDYISIVDEHTFEQAKQNGSFGVSVPFADDLLELSGNWSDFQSKRTDYFNAINYHSHLTQGDFQHFEVTSPLAYPAWSDCIKTLASQNQNGLYAFKEQEDENAVVLTIYYKVPEDSIPSAKKVRLQGTVKYGDGPEEQLFSPSSLISSEQQIAHIVKRRSVNGQPQKMYLAFNAGKKSAYLFSEWQPKLPDPTHQDVTQPLSQQFPLGLNTEFKLFDMDGHYAIKRAPLTVDGRITSVVYEGATGDGADHIWYLPNRDTFSPDHKTVYVVIKTDHGIPEPKLYFRTFYDEIVSTCIGRDGQPHGAGCPVRSPSEVLKGRITQPVF